MDCTSDVVSNENLLGLHIGGLFGILAISSIGVFLPLLTAAWKLDRLFFVLRAAAGGVVLATGFVHVLADAFPMLLDPCLELSDEYPWAMTFATFAALGTFVLEWSVGRHYKRVLDRIPDTPNGVSSIEDGTAIGKDPVNRSKSPDKAALTSQYFYTTASITFECGIIFHSIFIGISFGLMSDESAATALMIALFFHQMCEGLALGALFVKARYSVIKYVILGSLFLLVTPIGVAIGIGVGSSYQASSKAALGTEGVFNSVSAGILIYNAIADLIIPTFNDDIPSELWIQCLGFFSLFAGAGVMALIGKWA